MQCVQLVRKSIKLSLGIIFFTCLMQMADWLSSFSDAKKRCYAPSVQDKQSNMAFYHVGKSCQLAIITTPNLASFGFIWSLCRVMMRLSSEIFTWTYFRTNMYSSRKLKYGHSRGHDLRSFADTLDCVKSMPPYGIREPQETYQDGSPREEGKFPHVRCSKWAG